MNRVEDNNLVVNGETETIVSKIEALSCKSMGKLRNCPQWATSSPSSMISDWYSYPFLLSILLVTYYNYTRLCKAVCHSNGGGGVFFLS